MAKPSFIREFALFWVTVPIVAFLFMLYVVLIVPLNLEERFENPFKSRETALCPKGCGWRVCDCDMDCEHCAVEDVRGPYS